MDVFFIYFIVLSYIERIVCEDSLLYGAVAQVVSSRQTENLEIVVQLHAAPRCWDLRFLVIDYK